MNGLLDTASQPLTGRVALHCCTALVRLVLFVAHALAGSLDEVTDRVDDGHMSTLLGI